MLTVSSLILDVAQVPLLMITVNVYDSPYFMAVARYWSLAHPHKYELEVKKSRFLAFAWPVESPDEVSRFVSCTFGY